MRQLQNVIDRSEATQLSITALIISGIESIKMRITHLKGHEWRSSYFKKRTNPAQRNTSSFPAPSFLQPPQLAFWWCVNDTKSSFIAHMTSLRDNWYLFKFSFFSSIDSYGGTWWRHSSSLIAWKIRGKRHSTGEVFHYLCVWVLFRIASLVCNVYLLYIETH